jgi:hypothetical protein
MNIPTANGKMSNHIMERKFSMGGCSSIKESDEMEINKEITKSEETKPVALTLSVRFLFILFNRRRSFSALML